MNFQSSTTYTKLSDEEINRVGKLFKEFFRYYAEDALSGQLDFVESIYEQFTQQESLSEKQISALENIITACEGFQAAYDDPY